MKKKTSMNTHKIQPLLVELGVWLTLISALPFLYHFVVDESANIGLKIVFVTLWLSTSITMSRVTLQRLEIERKKS